MIRPSDFETQCQTLDLDKIEHQIARWVRKFEEPPLGTRLEAENVLLRLSLECATLDPAGLFAPDGSADHATTLLARALGNLGRPRQKSAATFYVLASVSYAIAGNFASASVWARKALPKTNKESFEHWIVSTLATRVQHLSSNSPRTLRRYARKLDTALSSGDPVDFEQATHEFNVVCGEASSWWPEFDRFLLLFWRAIHNRCWQLSAARVLTKSGFKNARYIAALRMDTSALLFPSQVHVLEEKGFLSRPGNALVLLPTSTGKTLLGELAMLTSLSDERPLAVYLAPYRALADQVARRMERRLQALGIRCEIRRGGYLEGKQHADHDSQRVLVATPEAFDALMREHPELYPQISCCVFDEFHLIEQPGRGLIYEGLAARLMSLDTIYAPRIVALSPVLSRSETLSDWLHISEDSIFSSSWKPTARRIAISTPDSAVNYFTPGERLHSQRRRDSEPAWTGEVTLPHRIDVLAAPPNYGLINIQRRRVLDNISAIALEQHTRFGEPVLVVCMNRAQTRALAQLAISGLSELNDDSAAVSLAKEVSRRFPYLQTLARALRHGVAYHNASLPGWVREKLEALMEKKELKLVMATTTLAEGVDLPFRVVVMAGWQQRRFGRQQPMPSLLFRNIAGRCGRAGVYVEGDTIIADNPEQSGVRFKERLRSYLSLYVQPSDISLKSALSLELSARNDDEEVGFSREASAALESQFAAFLDASTFEDHQEERFASSLFAGKDTKVRPLLMKRLKQFSDEMVEAEDYPLMQVNSPLSLTPFGRVALATGLSGRSCLNLVRFLDSYLPGEEPRIGKRIRQRLGIQWEPLVAALAQHVLEGEFVIELETGEFESIRDGRKGYPIKADSFTNVVLAWLSGTPLPKIAQMLTKDSVQRKDIDEWLSGLNHELPAFLEEDVEQLAVFFGGYVTQRWAWVLRAAGSMAGAIGKEDVQGESKKLARRMEYGVRFVEAANLMAIGCPTDRTLVDALVGGYLEEGTQPFDRTEFRQWLLTLKAERIARELPGAGNADGWLPAIGALVDFLG
ncbi:DEAD/DEAH box helicase [Archangium sp. Cb G35]|uniref:DEAD/DEAH box helicase n=1 Tax=Archangium sp. Cb G35 TaxID=1920190 RepID=UPI0009F8CA19|nr:DEAD/DEAH box helicase [Archangium sp. Cb G35]